MEVNTLTAVFDVFESLFCLVESGWWRGYGGWSCGRVKIGMGVVYNGILFAKKSSQIRPTLEFMKVIYTIALSTIIAGSFLKDSTNTYYTLLVF